MDLTEADWTDDDADMDSQDSSSFNIDKDGVRYDLILGWYPEQELKTSQRTQWVSLASADATTSNGGHLCHCGAILIKPELMGDARRDFASIKYQSRQLVETTQVALAEVLDGKNGGAMREQYRGLGIWGSDEEDDRPWILVFERFFVAANARRQRWGRKMATRILSEITAEARRARKAVVVLVMPAPPEREITAQTAGLSVRAKQRWREESIRAARAFWRSIGFVRIGETLFFGWTRHVQSSAVVANYPVRPEDLARDADIDRRKGYLHLLKK